MNQTAHVHDRVAQAERGPPLGEHHAAVAGETFEAADASVEILAHRALGNYRDPFRLVGYRTINRRSDQDSEEVEAIDYVKMPRATYSRPQVASIGLTAQQCEERGLKTKVGKMPMMAVGKAIIDGDTTGFVKIITDAQYGEILGAHMVGPDVTELLPELTLAQFMEITPDEIARTVHAHPTLSEVIMEAAHAVDGQPIHG